MASRVLAFVFAALIALATGRAAALPPDARFISLAPVEDASLPFGCDWSYDWDARCVRDDSARLPVGGDAEREWRVALRFSLDALPQGAGIHQGRLTLFHDGTCIGRRGKDAPCPHRAYALEAHAILDPDWTHEREVAFDPTPVARAVLPDASVPAAIEFDVGDLVLAWLDDEIPVAGILVRLAPTEPWASGGPKLASSTFPALELRPRLDVAYVPPSTPGPAEQEIAWPRPKEYADFW
jgi:hypothetical protein